MLSNLCTKAIILSLLSCEVYRQSLLRLFLWKSQLNFLFLRVDIYVEHENMELIVFLVFLAIALLGWGCGALHDKVFNYQPLPEEHVDDSSAAHEELSLRDILKTNSIKGYQAI